MLKRRTKNKISIIMQTVFLFLSLVISLFWFQEMERANNPLIPFVAFLFVCATIVVFIINAFKKKNPNLLYCAYGIIDLALLGLIIFIIYSSLQPQSNIQILPSLSRLTAFIKKPSLNSFYWLGFEIMPILHIITFAIGFLINFKSLQRD